MSWEGYGDPPGISLAQAREVCDAIVGLSIKEQEDVPLYMRYELFCYVRGLRGTERKIRWREWMTSHNDEIIGFIKRRESSILTAKIVINGEQKPYKREYVPDSAYTGRWGTSLEDTVEE